MKGEWGVERKGGVERNFIWCTQAQAKDKAKTQGMDVCEGFCVSVNQRLPTNTPCTVPCTVRPPPIVSVWSVSRDRQRQTL